MDSTEREAVRDENGENPDQPIDLDNLGEQQSAAEMEALAAAEAAELPFDVEKTTYTSYWGELAEICYAGGGQIADLRTSAGTEDNSGDYTAYPAL